MSGTEQYEGHERRRSGLSMDDLHTISRLLQEGREEQRLHFDEKIVGLQELFKSAFPGGDPAAHRLVHESQIKTAAFWSDTKGKIFIAGATTAIAGMGAILWWVGGVVAKTLGFVVGK